MRWNLAFGAFLTAVLVSAAGVGADDRWEFGTLNHDDNAAWTANFLTHGTRQTHDLQGLPGASDFDWMIVAEKANHSYEGRISAETLQFTDGTCATCAQFDRVDSAGTVLTPGVSIEGNLGGSVARTLVVRWTATADAIRYLRARGYEGLATSAQDTYDVDFVDTTVFLPRWNSSGGQSTVVLVQNTSGAAVNGLIHFYNAAGTELASQPFSAAVRASYSVSTASLPALNNAAGTATITHGGGWGALASKAVAVQPSTGFSFDTPGVYLPR